MCCCLEVYDYGVNEQLNGNGLLRERATEKDVSE